jgi:hypothetical protein
LIALDYVRPSVPFPGMRPFETADADLFFGQEEQVRAVVTRLGNSRLVAVLGESGCGKSSLVKAGLIPTLLGRRPAMSPWRVAVCRPGSAPVQQLASALAGTLSRLPEDAVEQQLRGCSYGLADVIAAADLPRGHRVLLVVDQFEELFRFMDHAEDPIGRRDEAALFVKLLLGVSEWPAAPDSSTVPVYVVITMRSEYLGDCALFFGLAEAINQGVYLLPKMTRASLERAITGPTALFGAHIDNELLHRLLNETESAQQDGLPLLQHGLRRVWESAAARSTPVHMRLQDLECVNAPTTGPLFLEKHLNAHLDALLGQLPQARRDTAVRMFKQLGEYNTKGRLVRRSCDLHTVARVCGVPVDEVLAVADTFRDEEHGRTFLMPGKALTPALLEGTQPLDISHEALLRRWATLRTWIAEETRNADEFRALADRARNAAGVLRGAELLRANTWQKTFNPTAEWAARYEGSYDAERGAHRYDFEETTTYLQRCRRQQHLRRASYVVAATFLVGLLLFVVVQMKERERDQESARAREKYTEALEAQKEQLALQAAQLREQTSALEIQSEVLSERNAELVRTTTELKEAQATLATKLSEEEKLRLKAESLKEAADLETVRANEQAAEAQRLRDVQKAAADRRDRLQKLRVLALQDPPTTPAAIRRRLRDLTVNAKEYHKAGYNDIPREVIAAIQELAALSFLQVVDAGEAGRPTEPVLLALPDPRKPGAMLTIRKGTPIESLGATVDRRDWTVQRATWNAGSKQIALGGAGGFTVIRPAEGQPIVRKLHNFAVTSVGFSTDGQWMATASASGDMRLHEGVDRVAFRDGFRQFVNASKLLWYLSIRRLQGDYAVREFAISLDPQAPAPTPRSAVTVVALTDAGRLLRWRRPGPFGKQFSRIDQLAVDGTFLSVATNPATQEVWAARADSTRSTLGIVDLETRRFSACPRSTFPSSVSVIAWNPAGTHVALGFRDGTLRLFSKAKPAGCEGLTPTFVVPAHDTAVTTAVWDGETVTTGSVDGAARLWSVPSLPADRELVARLNLVTGLTRFLGSLAVRPENRLVELLGLIEQRLGRLDTTSPGAL